MVAGEEKISHPHTNMAPLVSGTDCCQEDIVAWNRFRQPRTSGIDKINDLSIARACGFVYTATNYQGNPNASDTVLAFHAYSLSLIRKTLFSR